MGGFSGCCVARTRRRHQEAGWVSERGEASSQLWFSASSSIEGFNSSNVDRKTGLAKPPVTTMMRRRRLHSTPFTSSTHSTNLFTACAKFAHVSFALPHWHCPASFLTAASLSPAAPQLCCLEDELTSLPFDPASIHSLTSFSKHSHSLNRLVFRFAALLSTH